MATRDEWQRRMAEANRRICGNSRELQRAISDWAQAAVQDSLDAVVAAIIDCYGRLVQRTPKETGRAQAGWHIEGRTDDWAPEPGDYKDKIAALIAEQTEKLSGDLRQADVIRVMNNVEYILALEAGWSRQFAGFTALFLSELRTQLEQAAQNSQRGNA